MTHDRRAERVRARAGRVMTRSHAATRAYFSGSALRALVALTWAVPAVTLILPRAEAWAQALPQYPRQPVAPLPLPTDLPALEPVWPARWSPRAGDAQPYLAVRESLLRPVKVIESRTWFGGADAHRAEDRADFERLARELPAGAPVPRFEAEGSNAYVVRLNDPPAADEPGAQPPQARRDRPRLAFKVISAQPRADDAKTLVLERTSFVYLDATGQAKDVPRAIVLIMPGMFGTPEPIIDQLQARLRSSGYAVLRMLAHPGRFTERFEHTIDPANLDASAKILADTFGTRTAEAAYAVERAFAFVAEKVPGAGALPRVAVGMSGGGMILPTVVAREVEKYAGAIIIGGGCNFWGIAESSNYGRWIAATSVRWPSPPTEEQRRALHEKYLRVASMDSYHTAARLRGRRVLLLQGASDQAVPAAYGDLLWERLGRPERRLSNAGHELLFMMLPTQWGEVLSWIDASVSAAEKRPQSER